MLQLQGAAASYFDDRLEAPLAQQAHRAQRCGHGARTLRNQGIDHQHLGMRPGRVGKQYGKWL